jgi:uncharacterized protein (TIGR00156 family)
MKKMFLSTITGLCLLSSSMIFAKSDEVLLKEATKNVVTVAKAKNLRDEAGVTLKGTIVQHISGDNFEFKDSTGSIVIDVDDDLWRSLQLKAGDKVTVIGEVDTHRKKPTDIDVIQIERTK